MMDMKEIKTQVISAKEKMFSSDVILTRKEMVILVVISVLTGMVMGLCKGMKICTGKKDKECNKKHKCKKQDCCETA